MADIDVIFVNQLIDTMIEAVNRLEGALKKNSTDDVVKLKTFILDLQKRIDEALGGENV